MKASIVLLTIALAMAVSIPPATLAKDQRTVKQTLNMSPRIFLGGIFLAGDSDNFSGTLEADNPKCVLTVSSKNNGLGPDNGVGPNGSILLDGSEECAGSFELFLSNGTDQFKLPTSGGIGNNTGVYSGTFTIISAKDQQTAVWSGTYTQVYNINPTGGPGGFCTGLTFCANLGPAFGDETFNGQGLSYLIQLNGFTWNIPED